MTLYFHLQDEPSEDKHPFTVRLGRLRFRIRRTRARDLHGSDVAASPEKSSTDRTEGQFSPPAPGTAEVENPVLSGRAAWEIAAVDLDKLTRLDLRPLEPALFPARRREESIEQLNL